MNQAQVWHGVYGVFVISHIHQRIATPWQQHATVVVHHLRQTWDKHFVMLLLILIAILAVLLPSYS